LIESLTDLITIYVDIISFFMKLSKTDTIPSLTALENLYFQMWMSLEYTEPLY
jgi:hypothetical protein